jgi:hypothetical protein
VVVCLGCLPSASRVHLLMLVLFINVSHTGVDFYKYRGFSIFCFSSHCDLDFHRTFGTHEV